MIMIVMGVAGSGKTTVGRALAERLGCPFVEGDDLHPPANIAKMTIGQPLDDHDRWRWLAAVARAIRAARQSRHSPVVVACSALRRRYRRMLERGFGTVTFVYLKATPRLVRQRLADRVGHFMPTSLIKSQFAALEPPRGAVTIDARLPIRTIIFAVARHFRRHCLSTKAIG